MATWQNRRGALRRKIGIRHVPPLARRRGIFRPRNRRFPSRPRLRHPHPPVEAILRALVGLGRTCRCRPCRISAIDAGYARAITTIVDANLTTGIAAAVLYQYGSGPIKGFATVLFWGIIVSMFTAIIVTRFMFDFITSRKNIEKLSI